MNPVLTSQTRISEPPKIRFIHLRYYDDNEKMLNNAGVTVGYQDLGNSRFRVAYSRCHWRDHFCKKIGRAVVQGRLAKGDCWEITKVDEGEDVFSFIVDFVNRKITEHEQAFEKAA